MHPTRRPLQALASQAMATIGEALGLPQGVVGPYRAAATRLADPAHLEALHWDSARGVFADWGLHTEDVRLEKVAEPGEVGDVLGGGMWALMCNWNVMPECRGEGLGHVVGVWNCGVCREHGLSRFCCDVPCVIMCSEVQYLCALMQVRCWWSGVRELAEGAGAHVTAVAVVFGLPLICPRIMCPPLIPRLNQWTQRPGRGGV
jgi:hypothetical protein